MKYGKTLRLIAVVLAVVALVTVFAVPASAAIGYPMSCSIYYKDEKGNQLAKTKTFSVNAADGPDQTVGYASPTIAGYELKNSGDSFVTYAMMTKSFPASNYVRNGSATYTVVYCPTYTHTVYYLYGASMRTAATSQTFTSKANTYYVLYSPSVTGYSPNKNSVTGVQQSSNTSEQVYYYENTYTVSYNANGGSGAPSAQTKYYFSTLTLTTVSPYRSGYSFLGWSTSSTAKSATYSPGGSFTTNANTTLYAVWKKNTYTISYNANGGSGAPASQTKTEGVTLTLSSTKPTRSGYTFIGWSTSSTATSATYSAGGGYTANANTTLYAVWQKNLATYTVSYNANGGSEAPASQTKTEGVTLTLSSTKPTRTGYTFKGWSTSSTGINAVYSAGGKYTANASVILYAVWQANTYTVSYDANGGSGAPASQTKTYGKTLTLSSMTPVRDNYKFLGWSTSSAATTATYTAGGNFSGNATTILYAVWQEINYDFSVSNLVITPDTVYQYDKVSVNFRMDSWDRYNPYSDIPVAVYLNGKQIYSSEIEFSAYGVNYVTFDLSVGALEGTQTIEARVNWSDHSNETRTANNNVSVTFEVRKLVEVSADKVSPGGDYLAGNEVVSSFYVKNDSASPVLPSDHMTFDFEVYELNGSTETLLLKKTWNDVVIPANGKNLVYFKWTVPEGGDGKLYLCRGTANAGNIGGEQNTENNAVFFTVTAKSASEAVTPNTRYERNTPASYVNGTTPPTTATGSVSWTRWVYENGSFALKTYGLKVSTANPIVSPDASCPTAVKEGDKWKMRSGYGYSLEWSPTITALSGSLMPGSDAYTGIQSIFATLPEYRYLQESGKYETLQSSGGSYRFRQNEDADGNARIHFIPVYVANGNYTVSVTASQIWTPVGMVTATRNANTVLIDGSIYDDYYVGN